MQKETRQTGWLLCLFISSAGREETPCHFIHSSPVNLSVLLNILRSFRNDRAHYTLCFRRSSLTYFALKYDISVSDLRGAVQLEFFHSEQKGERTQSALSSLQCAEQLQSHSAKSIQTQSRSAPQKGITSPYRSNYITYKPNKRAQADLSAHRLNGLRLRGGNRAKLNNNSYIPQYDVYVKSKY